MVHQSLLCRKRRDEDSSEDQLVAEGGVLSAPRASAAPTATTTTENDGRAPSLSPPPPPDGKFPDGTPPSPDGTMKERRPLGQAPPAQQQRENPLSPQPPSPSRTVQQDRRSQLDSFPGGKEAHLVPPEQPEQHQEPPPERAVPEGVLAAQTISHHLNMCLKYLSVVYRGLEVNDRNFSQLEPHYLTVVMLNSSLLKALHVAEAFQQHCLR